MKASSQRRFRVIWAFTGIMLASWAVCFWPARLLRGQAGVWWMSLAAICCLVPGWIIVFLSRLAIFPNDLAELLTQTLLRLGLIGAAALLVRQLYPAVGVVDFYGWLTGFYILALVAETILARRS